MKGIFYTQSFILSYGWTETWNPVYEPDCNSSAILEIVLKFQLKSGPM